MYSIVLFICQELKPIFHVNFILPFSQNSLRQLILLLFLLLFRHASFLLTFADCSYENQHVEELKCFTIISMSAPYQKFSQTIDTYCAINQSYSNNKSGYNQFGNTVKSKIQPGDTSVLICKIADQTIHYHASLNC